MSGLRGRVPEYSPEMTDPPSRAYARYVLGVMFLLTALNVMDRQVLATLAEPVRAEFALSDSVMGILLGSAFGLAHVVAMIPAGRLADRGSRRDVLAGGLFLWSTLTTLTGMAAAAWHLFVTRVGVAIGEAAGSGPAQSLKASPIIASVVRAPSGTLVQTMNIIESEPCGL